MPSGPKKRKSARRKNEAAKDQGHHSPYSVNISDKYSEKDAFLEELDEEFSSPSPQTSHQKYKLSSSETKVDKLRKTEEWIRLSKFGARPCQGEIETREAASEDPDVISPSISGPSDKLADCESISSNSFLEDSQCVQTSECESKPKVLIGTTDLDMIDAYISQLKPLDDDQSDSGIQAESGLEATDKNSMEENHSEHTSKEIVRMTSICENNFDRDCKTGIDPGVNVEELKSKQQNHISLDSDSHGKPEPEMTVGAGLSDEHMTSDLVSVAPKKVLLGVLKEEEMAVTASNEKDDAEQNADNPKLVGIEGNKDCAILLKSGETDTAKEGMTDTEEYSRVDNELPGSSGIMDKEASLSVCGDACQKSFEKNSEISAAIPKSNVENSSIWPESTKDVQKESFQQLKQHKVADHAPLVSEELKTGHYSEDKAIEISASHRNQVEEGTSDHKMLTSWKDCCGAFEWVFGWSHRT